MGRPALSDMVRGHIRERLAGFRVGRRWLKEREEALLAAGWTKAGLYRIRKPFGHPYLWGAAWSSWWLMAKRITFSPATGIISLHVGIKPGDTHILEARPR